MHKPSQAAGRSTIVRFKAASSPENYTVVNRLNQLGFYTISRCLPALFPVLDSPPLGPNNQENAPEGPSHGKFAMKQLTVVVKPFVAEAVLKAIADLDVTACIVQEAKGYSRQKGYLDRYVGSEYSLAFLPKVEISVWVNDTRVAEVADRIVRTARTGRMGDGKLFIVDTGWPGGLEF
jgi:nitrogen regulatory protein PII